MRPFPSYYNELMGSASNQSSFLQGLVSSSEIAIGGEDSNSDSKSTAEEKALAASKKHSEAEKRRRERLNGHYATLRTLLPKTIKAHKASVLAETVRHVIELKKRAAELEASEGGSMGGLVLPGDTDEVHVGYCEKETSVIKATVCCEDREGLMSDLTRAVRSVKGMVVRAEMGTVGGRTKNVVWVQGLGSGDDGLGTLKRALKVVVDKPSTSTSGLGQGNKRTRVSL
nr:basic helix-loop-helix transcription factor [Loropetalum chinense var. rubrum]